MARSDVPDRDPAEVEIPTEVAERIAVVLEAEEPPATVAEWIEATRRAFDARPATPDLDPDALCTTESSRHAAEDAAGTTHYQCVLDAFIAAYLREGPVTVRTTPPGGDEELVLAFEDGELVAAPEAAVMSYGAARSVEPPGGEPSLEQAYGQLCGYSHAFPTREDYERWDESATDAVTAAVDLPTGLGIARTMADQLR